MEFQKLEVRERTSSGKGSSHKIRNVGRVPGVVYGRGFDPVSIDLAPKDLKNALQGPYKRNTVLSLIVKGMDGKDTEMLAMLQEHQIHPRDRNVLHVDFLRVDMDSDVEVEVPLITTGKCQGVQMGGILLQPYHELPIRCRPADIPVCIEHDITAVNIGQSVKAAELPLPSGVTVMLEPDQAVLSVAAPEAEEVPAVEEAAEGEEKKEEEGAKDEKGKEKAKEEPEKKE